MDNIFKTKHRRVSIFFDVIIILIGSLLIHTPRIPIAALGLTLRAPVRPDTKFGIPEPIRYLIIFK
ncbi:hypothetical protein D3C79_1095300 [compost metagenome]